MPRKSTRGRHDGEKKKGLDATRCCGPTGREELYRQTANLSQQQRRQTVREE